MSATPLAAFPVTVHEFLPSPRSKKLCHVYEYDIHDYFAPSADSQANANALVFIGGLGDGPHGVPYIRYIAAALKSPSFPSLNYTVFEARLSSAFTGWGVSSLAEDVKEIASVVRYLKTKLRKRKVVLMGHSTGCQDCVAYLHQLARQERRRRDPQGKEEEEEKEEQKNEDEIPEVDAIILQGPVSDREAFGMCMSEQDLEEARNLARRMIDEGKEDEYMPRDKLPADMRNTPVTAYRWYSLASRLGDDDFFSSDLSDTEAGSVWNRLSKPVLIVPSEEDEWVPKTTDASRLLKCWEGHCRPGVYSELSGLIPGANHRVDNDEGRKWLSERVLRFLGEVKNGIEIGDFKQD